MENDIYDICKIKEKEFEHKKKMDRSYFWFHVISMLLDKGPPLILDVIRLVKQKTMPQKSWQDTIYFKKLP